MSDWFKTHIQELLPTVYLEQDQQGDLQIFLQLVAEVLDELKGAMDAFPDIFAVERCQESFLPLLSGLVGCQCDRGLPAEVQRRMIKEAVESYRRKGTLPALVQELNNSGWQGRIEETFKQTCRLNNRSRLTTSRLPGKLFSLGVYRVISDNQSDSVREIVGKHHPAGMAVFFGQEMLAGPSLVGEALLNNLALVRQTAFCRSAQSFLLNGNQLNSRHHLNIQHLPASALLIATSSFTKANIDYSSLRLTRYQGRQNAFLLNNQPLNKQKLVVCTLNEINLSCHSLVYTGDEYQETLPGNGFRLSRNQLNKRNLPFAIIVDTYF